MKRIVSLLLVVVLCAAMVVGSSVTANGCPAPSTVYFVKNSLFTGSDLFLYYWTPDGDAVMQWPGIPMSYYGENVKGEEVYQSDLPYEQIGGFIISDNNGNQTVDLNDTGGASVLIMPHEAVDDNGHYSVSIKNVDVLDPLKVTDENWATPLPDKKNVYFTDNGSFGDCFLYYWDDGAGEYEWPGVLMEYCGLNVYGENVYTYEIPYDCDGFIVNNGKGTQTCDIMNSNEWYSVLVTLDDKKDESGHYTVSLKDVEGKDPLNIYPDKKVYFIGDGVMDPAYIYSWDKEGHEVNLWPGAQMRFFGVNVYGENVYTYEVPFETEGLVISDGNGSQSCEIMNCDEWSSVLIEVSSEQNELGHYKAKTTKLDGLDPLNPIPIPDDKKVYFVDNGEFEDFYIYYWFEENGPYEWPGVPMRFYGVNAEGKDVYTYELPYQYNGFIINDGKGRQTFDIMTDYESLPVLVTLGEQTGEFGHYSVDTTPIGGLDPLDITKPKPPVAQDGSLIVVDNNLYGMSGSSFEEPLYICCRKDGDQEATLCAEMELFDRNDLDENVYRFTVPKGMQYYYITDGTKRSVELPVAGEDHVYFDGTFDQNHNYHLLSVGYGYGDDPYFDAGDSNTIFDRFLKAYTYTTTAFPRYEELYTHRNGSGEADWMLFSVESNWKANGLFKDVIGNRFVDHSASSEEEFPSHYGIYDFKKGTFVPLNSDVTDRYDGLARVFDEYGTGRLFGDLDGDDCLTIIDVTLFQRCEAQICEYPDDELLDDYFYRHAGTYCFSDFNRDGNRDIVDATYIQRYLAAMI